MPAASPARPPRRSSCRLPAAPPPRTKPLSEREFWELYPQVQPRLRVLRSGEIRCDNGDCPIVAVARVAGLVVLDHEHLSYWEFVRGTRLISPRWARRLVCAADEVDFDAALRARLLPPPRRGKGGAK